MARRRVVIRMAVVAMAMAIHPFGARTNTGRCLVTLASAFSTVPQAVSKQTTRATRAVVLATPLRQKSLMLSASAAAAASSSSLFSNRDDEQRASIARTDRVRQAVSRSYQQWKRKVGVLTATSHHVRWLWSKPLHLQRSVVVWACLVCLFWHTPLNPLAATPAMAASTTTATTTTGRPLSSSSTSTLVVSSSLDTLIDRYVQQHMFDDDLGSAMDPIASIFQEVQEDITTGRHASALRDIVTKIVPGQSLFRTASKSVATSLSSPTIGGSGGGGLSLVSLIRGLQLRTGWSEMVVTMALASVFVVAGPSLFLLAGMMVGNISKRNMDQLFKKRYGDTYTVDATAKQEPSVEAPEDDDDDDDEDVDDTPKDGKK